MRFEGKNHQLKQLVGLNFKNVAKTVATRHQYYMCMQLLSPPGHSTTYLYKGDEIGKGETDGGVIVNVYYYTYYSRTIDC